MTSCDPILLPSAYMQMLNLIKIIILAYKNSEVDIRTRNVQHADVAFVTHAHRVKPRERPTRMFADGRPAPPLDHDWSSWPFPM